MVVGECWYRYQTYGVCLIRRFDLGVLLCTRSYSNAWICWENPWARYRDETTRSNVSIRVRNISLQILWYMLSVVFCSTTCTTKVGGCCIVKRLAIYSTSTACRRHRDSGSKFVQAVIFSCAESIAILAMRNTLLFAISYVYSSITSCSSYISAIE